MYEIFARLLQERKLNINKVSKATGIPSSTLYSWKSGVAQLKQDKLVLIADYLGVTVSYLMGLPEDNIYNEENTINLEKFAVYKELIEEIDTLTPEQQNMVKSYISFLKTNKPS